MLNLALLPPFWQTDVMCRAVDNLELLLSQPDEEIKSAFNDLDKYQRLAKEANEVHRVFVGSMMDIFEKPMPVINSKGEIQNYSTEALRAMFFQRIHSNQYPNLMFLLLTKRPSNINKYIPLLWAKMPPKTSYIIFVLYLHSENSRCKTIRQSYRRLLL